MRHLIRAGGLMIAVFLLVFVGIRLVPVPAFMVGFGFHEKNSKANEEVWASLPIQFANSATCLDCHVEKYNMWQAGDHKSVICEDCHGPAAPHLETGEPLKVDDSRRLCGLCHVRLPSRPAGFPQVDIDEMGRGTACVVCHDPHDPRAGMPPQVPHAMEGRSDCQSCHAPHEALRVPPPQVPHTLTGRTDCVSCHGPQELRGKTLPRIPHSLEGRSNCLICHNAQGYGVFPEDHAGRTSFTCLECHRP